VTFREFLDRADTRDNPRGDIILDMRADRRFHPEHIRGWQQLQSYLYKRGASYQAHQAAERLWREYERRRV
jgi:hypothetical protein